MRAVSCIVRRRHSPERECAIGSARSRLHREFAPGETGPRTRSVLTRGTEARAARPRLARCSCRTRRRLVPRPRDLPDSGRPAAATERRRRPARTRPLTRSASDFLLLVAEEDRREQFRKPCRAQATAWRAARRLERYSSPRRHARTNLAALDGRRRRSRRSAPSPGGRLRPPASSRSPARGQLTYTSGASSPAPASIGV